jgi:hypothetical protein
MARWIQPGTLALGLPVRHPHYRRRVEALDHSGDSAWMRLVDPSVCPERLLSSLGLPYVFAEDEPVLLTGLLVGQMDDAGLRRTLQRGCVIDAEAVDELHHRGLGSLLGVRVAGEIRSYAAVRFSDDPIHGPYASSLLPIRRIYALRKLEYDAQQYQPLSAVVSAGVFAELGPGVLRRTQGSPLVVLPHVLRAPLDSPGGNEAGLLVNLPHRHLLARLLAWLRPQALPAWFDGPLFVSTCCYRGPQGELIVALLNPHPDVIDDAELVLADGVVRGSSVAHVLGSDGHLRACPAWKPQHRGSEWRLSFDADHALSGCDVLTLVIR